MHALHSCSNYQNYLNRICLLLALIFLSFFVLSGTLLRSVHADGGDLLQNIPPVNENSIDNAACGVAAATMILDYYLPQSGSVHTPPDIHTVAKYVKEDSQGTTGSDLQTGIEAAALAYGNHSNTSWDATDSANWFTTLKSELDAMRPVIVYIPNGGNLGWNWKYPHYIVVSGYTSDNSIIYHDPWDGNPHTHSNADFAKAWGTTWKEYSPWLYMQITASFTPSTATPVLTPTQPLSTTPSPTLSPSPSATSIPIPVPTFTQVPTPDPTPVPPTLTVSSTNLLPSVCPWHSEAFLCTVTLTESSNSQGNLDWTASSSGSANITPPSGTLTPGQSTQVSIFVDCNTETFTFTGSSNTIQATWRCPTITVNPTSLDSHSTDCTFFSGSYECSVTLTESADSPENANWVADSVTGMQSNPPSGVLSPGQSVQVQFTYIPCQNFTLGFHYDGGVYLPIPWTCP